MNGDFRLEQLLRQIFSGGLDPYAGGSQALGLGAGGIGYQPVDQFGNPIQSGGQGGGDMNNWLTQLLSSGGGAGAGGIGYSELGGGQVQQGFGQTAGVDPYRTSGGQQIQTGGLQPMRDTAGQTTSTGAQPGNPNSLFKQGLTSSGWRFAKPVGTTSEQWINDITGQSMTLGTDTVDAYTDKSQFLDAKGRMKGSSLYSPYGTMPTQENLATLQSQINGMPRLAGTTSAVVGTGSTQGDTASNTGQQTDASQNTGVTGGLQPYEPGITNQGGRWTNYQNNQGGNYGQNYAQYPNWPAYQTRQYQQPVYSNWGNIGYNPQQMNWGGGTDASWWNNPSQGYGGGGWGMGSTGGGLGGRLGRDTGYGGFGGYGGYGQQQNAYQGYRRPAYGGQMSQSMYGQQSLGRYATGTPYVPQTGNYTLERGEAVIPAGVNPYPIPPFAMGGNSRPAGGQAPGGLGLGAGGANTGSAGFSTTGGLQPARDTQNNGGGILGALAGAGGRGYTLPSQYQSGQGLVNWTNSLLGELGMEGTVQNQNALLRNPGAIYQLFQGIRPNLNTNTSRWATTTGGGMGLGGGQTGSQTNGGLDSLRSGWRRNYNREFPEEEGGGGGGGGRERGGWLTEGLGTGFGGTEWNAGRTGVSGGGNYQRGSGGGGLQNLGAGNVDFSTLMSMINNQYGMGSGAGQAGINAWNTGMGNYGNALGGMGRGVNSYMGGLNNAIGRNIEMGQGNLEGMNAYMGNEWWPQLREGLGGLMSGAQGMNSMSGQLGQGAGNLLGLNNGSYGTQQWINQIMSGQYPGRENLNNFVDEQYNRGNYEQNQVNNILGQILREGLPGQTNVQGIIPNALGMGGQAYGRAMNQAGYQNPLNSSVAGAAGSLLANPLQTNMPESVQAGSIQGTANTALENMIKGGGLSPEFVNAQRQSVLDPSLEAMQGRLNKMGAGVAAPSSGLYQELQRRQERDFNNNLISQGFQNMNQAIGQGLTSGGQEFGQGMANQQMGLNAQQGNVQNILQSLGLGSGMSGQLGSQNLQQAGMLGSLGQGLTNQGINAMNSVAGSAFPYFNLSSGNAQNAMNNFLGGQGQIFNQGYNTAGLGAQTGLGMAGLLPSYQNAGSNSLNTASNIPMSLYNMFNNQSGGAINQGLGQQGNYLSGLGNYGQLAGNYATGMTGQGFNPIDLLGRLYGQERQNQYLQNMAGSEGTGQLIAQLLGLGGGILGGFLNR